MNSNKNIIPDTFLSEILQIDCFNIVNDIKTVKLLNKNSIYTYTFSFDHEVMNACNEKDFVYLGGRVDFKLRNRDKSQRTSTGDYEIITKKELLDLESIYKIAHTIAKTSRFYKDQYTKKYAFTIYKKWIENSLMHAYANDFFVFKKEDENVGLITLKKEKNGMRIDLIGISDAYQKKGVGTILIDLVKDKYKNENIYVGAQAENIGALNFYYKNGFIAEEYKMIYRKYT